MTYSAIMENCFSRVCWISPPIFIPSLMMQNMLTRLLLLVFNMCLRQCLRYDESCIAIIKHLPVCCVLKPVNGCFTSHLLVEIIFLRILTTFTATNGKKQRNWVQKQKKKYPQKTSKGVYRHLGAALKSWLTPKRWSTPEEKSNFFYFPYELTSAWVSTSI